MRNWGFIGAFLDVKFDHFQDLIRGQGNYMKDVKSERRGSLMFLADRIIFSLLTLQTARTKQLFYREIFNDG